MGVRRAMKTGMMATGERKLKPRAKTKPSRTRRGTFHRACGTAHGSSASRRGVAGASPVIGGVPTRTPRGTSPARLADRAVQSAVPS